MQVFMIEQEMGMWEGDNKVTGHRTEIWGTEIICIPLVYLLLLL